MKPKVLLAKPVPREVEEYIAEHCEIKRLTNESNVPREQLYQTIEDIEGLIGNVRVDQELLDHAPRLRVVSNISVGYNNFDLEAMKARNVMGTNTPYVLDETVADLVLGLMLATARRIPELDQYVKQGQWKKGDVENLFGTDVHHVTLGIIGMGRIGEAIARRAKFGFSMDVVYYNRNRKVEAEEQLGLRYIAFDDLLAQSDFVVLMTPLTPETTRLMGREQFSKMKKSAFFINASRGKTVDEAALVEALETKQIAGAGLDVFDMEPIQADHPLLKMPQVVTLPHIGSATAKTRLDMARVAAQNLVMAVKGEVPPHLVRELT